ncbi:hypothetical protein QM306_39745, partial [Burkholderia cenocepacia]|nr:hypothetical protein [Burkholderia cenocepacia]
PVRWMMRPHDSFMPMSDAQRQKADHDFLFEGVRERLAHAFEQEVVVGLLPLCIAHRHERIMRAHHPAHR